MPTTQSHRRPPVDAGPTEREPARDRDEVGREPSLPGRTGWMLLVGAALGAALLEGVQAHFGSELRERPASWIAVFAATLPWWLVLVSLMPAVAWMARHFRLERRRLLTSLPAHAVASVLFTALYLGVASWFSELAPGSSPVSGAYLSQLGLLATRFTVIGVSYYWGIVGVMSAFEYHRLFAARQAEAARLEIQAARLRGDLIGARLDALRLQLHPHFLFNTLNAIAILTAQGQREQVVKMVEGLSALLRAALEDERPVVRLREELSMLSRYLDIEKTRFGDRMQVKMTVEPEALDAFVPTLILQPIVENAVRYGIARRPGGGTLEIVARMRDGSLAVRVGDSGPGFPALDNPTRKIDFGIGLSNTRARLEQMYGGRAEMTLSNAVAAGGAVDLTIPLDGPDHP